MPKAESPLLFGLVTPSFNLQAPDKKGNIRCDRKPSTCKAILGLNEDIINSVIYDRHRKEAERSDSKEFSLLFHKGYTHTYKQGTHTVHKSCPKSADHSTEHAEIRITEKLAMCTKL